MKLSKYNIAKFICNLLGVHLIPPPIKTINISTNNNMKGDLDLSGGNLDENVNIDVSGTRLDSISFPSGKIDDKTKIYINGKII